MAFWNRAQPLTPQLVVEGDEPALFFSSVSAAEAYLEPIDVAEGTFPAAFGPHGERYSIETDGKAVFIQKILGVDPDPGALRLLLERFLRSLGQPAPADAELQELWRRCSKYTIS